MAVTRAEKKSEITTVTVAVADHALVSSLADARGMTMRAFMERWIRWMSRLDPSEQAIVLEQVARDDEAAIAELVLRRRKKAQREMDQLVERAHQGPGVIGGEAGGANATGGRVVNRPKTPAAG